jgi:hypothetical protein
VRAAETVLVSKRARDFWQWKVVVGHSSINLPANPAFIAAY